MFEISTDMILFDKFKYIFLDVDGVVLQSILCICDILNDYYKKDLSPYDIVSWDFKEFDNNITSKEIEDIFDSIYFFDNVKFYDGVIDFIKKYEHKIVCVTKGRDRNIELKKQLFQVCGLNVPIIGIPLTHSKDIVNMDGSIFIDDCTNNLTESNASVKIMFRDIDNDNSWQKGWNGMYMKGWV